MRVALVCIAKNEENYIDEWISYHKLLDFDRIFVYQNDWRYDIRDDKVQVEIMDGPVQQLPAYNKFIQDNHKNYDWAAFIDVDEFIVLKKHNDIKQFIADHSKGYPAIAINWFVFGGNNLVFDGNYKVIPRFKRGKLDKTIKSILKMNPGHVMTSPHTSNLSSYTKVIDPAGKVVPGNYNLYGTNEIAQINHYAFKTRKEYEAKIMRGRADCMHKRDIRDEPYENNLLYDSEDDSIFEMLNRLQKQ